MSILSRISDPADLRTLSRRELTELSGEIRKTLIETVAHTGGHLGPNLGVVELTIAIHRVFDSPHEPIIFDTGHQCYVHKLLTGRLGDFASLRQSNGMSGYPSRAESGHDWVENSHASTSLSWAEGLAKARKLQGINDPVVAVIGDGALTGGMAWEALNNIAVQSDLPIIIVVNDNGRSYTPTVGGIAAYLNGLRTDHRYEETLARIKSHVTSKPIGGRLIYSLMHAFKSGVKDVLAPQGLFSDLGIKYLGPIDGHAISWLERTLTQAKGFGGPVIVHCLTHKGRGFHAAENHAEDRFHAVGRINAKTGEALGETQPTGTSVIRSELLEIGKENDRVVALTAAMLHPTGLDAFAEAFPERTIDVGIAEQHAMTLSAGLARGGMHPVFALYATFLNRAFDQLLFDVALHRLPVTILLDRAGITGPDGASHHGMWDLSLANLIPHISVALPWDEVSLRLALREAVANDFGPTVVRFAKELANLPFDSAPTSNPAVLTDGGDFLVLGFGSFAPLGVEVATGLRSRGISATAFSPLWVTENPEWLGELNRFSRIVTIEDGCLTGGLGSWVRDRLPDIRVTSFGVPNEFIRHASRPQLLADFGLTADQIVASLLD